MTWFIAMLRCYIMFMHIQGDIQFEPIVLAIKIQFRAFKTADKFAQLPLQGPLHMLFGRVSYKCTRHGYRSPDLDRYADREERESHAGKENGKSKR